MFIKSLITKYGGTAAKQAALKPVQVAEFWARVAVRSLQAVIAFAMVIVYAIRVGHDARNGNPQDPAWVYAVVVGGMSCITCLVYMIPNPFFQSARLFVWDAILFILWIAVFGTFAGKFLKSEEDEIDGISVTTMKVAVWFDLTECLLWLGTAIFGFVRALVGRKAEAKFNQGVNKLDGKLNEKFHVEERLEQVEAFYPPARAHFQGAHAV